MTDFISPAWIEFDIAVNQSFSFLIVDSVVAGRS